MFDDEMNFVDELLRRDVRNNSVWNHRYFIINTSEEKFSPDVIDREVDYVLNALQIVLNNESVWNYLRG